MARPEAIAAAIRKLGMGTPSGTVSPLAAQMLQNNSYGNAYGPFFPRPSRTFTDGAFGPMGPINPVPVDEPPPGALFPDPRLWQYRVGWNLPTPPGTEGLKLASFDQLATLSKKYSVARQCIELRKDEILGLEWEITLTTDAAKAYTGDAKAMRDFGERKLLATKFFNHPDPDYWSFHTFMEALLEEIFVYDALSLVFRPKYGTGLGRGLLGSDLDHIKLVSGPTIRPLLDMHGGHPAPPAPAYQQYLYGVPRSDILSIMRGTDIEDYGLAGSEINTFRSDIMLYAPLKPTRETPYGFPPVERALLPIISGLQKQEFQLDYFTEGTIPAVYISPGDPNITPSQIKELQDALNAIAGDPAYHMKVMVLPPGSKVEPQRPVDLSDSFDNLVQTQVCMAFDVQPVELGILPNIGGGGSSGPSASAVRFAGQEARDLKTRKSTKPMLKFLCDIFNYVLHDICHQPDMQFQFEGLIDDEDKQQITELGVEQVQNGIASIDEVRERLDLPPWGMKETSEPVVFTAQGPIPFSMAPQLIMAAQQNSGGSGSSSGGSKGGSKGTSSGQKTTSTRSRTKQPTVRRGGQTKPNGSHPAPVSPHRESATPAHAAASGATQGPTPRTGGTTNRSPVAGSRKKAVASELDALKRHIRKGRLIGSWVPRHLDNEMLRNLEADITKGVLIDTAVDRLLILDVKEAKEPEASEAVAASAPEDQNDQQPVLQDTGNRGYQWPGWDYDLNLVSRYKEQVSDAFHRAEEEAANIRKDAVTRYSVSSNVLRSLINDEVKQVFGEALSPMWGEAWDLGYSSASQLLGEQKNANSDDRAAFIVTEGEHWLQQIARTGLGRNEARSEIIARTEIARAMNAGAMQCYHDHQVAYKHLLIAPDDTCDICTGAAADGIIPLDAGFSAKGLEPPFHPQCRCMPAPAGVEVVPPLGKSEQGPEKVAFLMIRARSPEDGKWHYLLQKRSGDGTWGLPGGGAHDGEPPIMAAIREATEEVGDLPPSLELKATLSQRREDKNVWIFLVETPYFHPRMNGSTPEETAGTGWFRRKEVSELNLHPHFRDQWENINWRDVAKAIAVNENGERSDRPDGPPAPKPTGANWPYPHRADGIQYDPDAPPDDWMNAVNTLMLPAPDDSKMPTARGRGGQGPQKPSPSGGAPSSPPNSGGQPPGASIGAGAAPSGKGMGEPVVGSVPAKAPKPMSPRSVPPQAFDPAETVESWSDEDESNVAVKLPPKKKKG